MHWHGHRTVVVCAERARAQAVAMIDDWAGRDAARLDADESGEYDEAGRRSWTRWGSRSPNRSCGPRSAT
ncbi:MAG: hypothetical protein KatS3mg010_0449 [Acidimicrobiia bacterium]|nr:MAG: hypothetical protein KatS3mg010_0449 [Acidimicrobiia bacterium]